MSKCSWCGDSISRAAKRDLGICSGCLDRGVPPKSISKVAALEEIIKELLDACKEAERELAPYKPDTLMKLRAAIARAGGKTR